MAEKQVYGLQLLTFLVNKYDYQIVNIKGLATSDYWLVSLSKKYPLVCITNEVLSASTLGSGSFGQVYRAILTTFTQPVDTLVLNTNPSSQKFESGRVLQIPVLENQPVDDMLTRVFPGIDHVVKKVEDVTQEKRKLTKELQKKARDEFYKQLKKSQKTPKITMIIAAICTLIFILSSLLYPITENQVTSGILVGAYYKMNVISAHEYWRLLTAGFVHTDMWHLFMNMIALFDLGLLVEGRLKKSQYLTVLLSSIIVGNLFVLIGDANIVGLGISGGLFGLLGVFSVMLFTSSSYKNPRILSSYITVIMMNVFISLLPNISLLAHLGGFLCGLALGIYYDNSPKVSQVKRHAMISLAAVVAACLITIPSVGRINPIYAGTDANIIRSLNQLHLEGYGKYLTKQYKLQMIEQGEDIYPMVLDSLIKGEGQ